MNDDRTVGGPPGESPSRDLEPTLDAPSAGQSAGHPSDAATVILPGAERPGTIIGPYKILQQIGEGGFGSVFMAEQEKPVQRRVALKIIKLGMDTRQVVARFEQERQALAMMDHPNIARVYDAGATETGRPYFAMELVKGEPIVHYCDKNNLSIEARLDLFAQVCNAVQHAHTKGIIHRDIKPTNILVSTQDGRPHAKVIDFGIAKATASKLTEKTLFTEFQQLIGTPEYMSPEQAEGSLDIDTRTDVYSLGAVLYELLTGSTPFSGRDLRSAAFAEIQRMIREVEPPKPSTRLSQSAGTLAGIAAARRTEPKRLGMIVRGELDWIVMRAMEKDRQRRYETASGLGADIRRYLSGDNVVAAPPAGYKHTVHEGTRKVAPESAVGAALVLIAGTVWQARAAADQRDKARQEATRALAAESETRRRAEDLQRVADFQGQMLAQVDPMAAGMRLTDDVSGRLDAALAKANLSDEDRAARMEAFIGMWSQISATDAALELIDRTILRPAAAALDTQFEDQPEIAATLRHVVAERYHDLGLDGEAVALQERVVEARRRLLGEDNTETVKSIGNLGVYQASLAMHKEAEANYREALERGRRVRGEDDPETMVYLANVGSILVQTGRFDEAEPVLREALERRRLCVG
ncbi:MAG: serine/threonine protein kinase [Phycisphaeraceae bacterium]|nr:serine/threonine protein kinase [Phycisphaeraceae bacterium]